VANIKDFTVNDVEGVVSLKVIGDSNITLTNFRAIDEANETSLVWINHSKPGWQEKIASTRARVIVCAQEAVMDAEFPTITWLVTDDPRLAYARIVECLAQKVVKPGIHPTAFVEPNAEIGEDVFIGPMCYVGCSRIGDGSILYGSNHIYDGVEIGRNVKIHAGVVVGADGFGYVKNEEGELEKFPHIGGVLIEDNVEIGANSCIDRATLGNTIIKEGACIDNLVHIAHNVVVGRNAAVIAHAMVGGSTVIGDQTWIAPSACLRNGISIGDNVTIGLAALVTKNVPDGETWAGFPARKLISKK
jgi:UDP-3-O-[3-hydroxymyristoyl] glucosamine N-acyltransferase